jgi:hypothetical protein
MSPRVYNRTDFQKLLIWKTHEDGHVENTTQAYYFISVRVEYAYNSTAILHCISEESLKQFKKDR